MIRINLKNIIIPADSPTQILKTAELSDLDMLVVLRSDLEVMDNTGYGGTQTKEEVREYLERNDFRKI